MTTESERRTLLKAGAAMLGGAMLPTATAQAQSVSAARSHEFLVKDIVYQTSGGKERLARLYQPAGNGPFPAAPQVPGRPWNHNARTDAPHPAPHLPPPGPPPPPTAPS